jgi:hypothetical protein
LSGCLSTSAPNSLLALRRRLRGCFVWLLKYIGPQQLAGAPKTLTGLFLFGCSNASVQNVRLFVFFVRHVRLRFQKTFLSCVQNYSARTRSGGGRPAAPSCLALNSRPAARRPLRAVFIQPLECLPVPTSGSVFACNLEKVCDLRANLLRAHTEWWWSGGRVVGWSGGRPARRRSRGWWC